jgi:rhodanese-related sulfurtransferase
MEYIVLCIFIFVIIFIFISRKKGGSMITAAEAREKILNSRLALLDVRSAQEFATGHLEGANLIPVSELNDRIDELRGMKDREIIVYCHAGNRSRTAASILKKNGFLHVLELQGGISEWVRTGNKIIVER